MRSMQVMTVWLAASCARRSMAMGVYIARSPCRRYAGIVLDATDARSNTDDDLRVRRRWPG